MILSLAWSSLLRKVSLFLFSAILAWANTAPADLKFLLEFYNSTDGENWMEGFTWTKASSF